MSEPNQPAPEVAAETQPYVQTVPVMEYPSAGTVMILGIIGIFVPVLSFIAWYMGAQAKKQIAAGSPYYWGGQLRTGYLLGKIWSIITIIGIVVGIIALILFLAALPLAANS